MSWVPAELQAVARRVEAGEVPVHTVRTLLSWFRAQRRGANTVALVSRAMRESGLQTSPSFENAWIDAEIEFHAAGPLQENPQAQPEPAPEEPPTPQQLPKVEPTTVAAIMASASVPESRPDPVHRVGKLEAANQVPLCVKPGTTLREATTLMMLRDFSQLPVSQSEFHVLGAISWRSIGRRTALHGPPSTVQECLEDAPLCSSEASVFDVAHIVHRHGYVLVKSAKNNKIQGLLTAADLSEQFGLLLAPFMLIGEIEGHLRALLDERLSLEKIREARAPTDKNRQVESAADLTFGEYKRLLEDKENWAKLGVTLDRVHMVNALEELRQTRNDLMHFQPEGIDNRQSRAVRELVLLLRELRGAAPG